MLGIKHSFVLNTDSDKNVLFNGEKGETPGVFMSRITRFYNALGYAPTIAMVCILISDITWMARRPGGFASWVQHVQIPFLIKFFVTESIAAIILLIVWRLNALTNRFQAGTTRTILKYESRMVATIKAGASA
jgi:hypothetical protein